MFKIIAFFITMLFAQFYMRVGILHTSINTYKTTSGEVWSHKTNLTSPLFSEALVPSQESDRSCICMLGVSLPSQESDQSCICMLGVSILHLSTILVLDFGTVSTILYFLFFILLSLEFYQEYIYCNDGYLVMMINISNTTQKLFTLLKHLNTSSFVGFMFFSICFVY